MPKELLELMNNSESVSDEDRDYFIKNYTTMTVEQVAELYEILESERVRLEVIDTLRAIVCLVATE